MVVPEKPYRANSFSAAATKAAFVASASRVCFFAALARDRLQMMRLWQ